MKVHKQVIRKLHPDYAASSFSLISPMITLKFIVYLIFLSQTNNIITYDIINFFLNLDK